MMSSIFFKLYSEEMGKGISQKNNDTINRYKMRKVANSGTVVNY